MTNPSTQQSTVQTSRYVELPWRGRMGQPDDGVPRQVSLKSLDESIVPFNQMPDDDKTQITGVKLEYVSVEYEPEDIPNSI